MFEDRWCLWEPPSYPKGGSCSSVVVSTSSYKNLVLDKPYIVIKIGLLTPLFDSYSGGSRPSVISSLFTQNKGGGGWLFIL